MKYVLVRWVDSTAGHGWRSREEAAAWINKPGNEQASVGFVVSRTKLSIVIAQSIQLSSNGNVAELLEIPSSAILSVKNLGTLKWT